MADNYIYIDETGAERQANQRDPNNQNNRSLNIRGNFNDEPSPIQRDMEPYAEGLGVQQTGGVNTNTALSDPIAIPTKPIYQAAVNKQSNEYIQALSDARNMLGTYTTGIKTDLANYYQKQLKEYYLGERDPNDPKKLKYPERPMPPTMDKVNEELEKRKGSILEYVTKHLNISDPAIKNSIYEQFDLKYQQAKRDVTSTVIKHEAQAAKDGYDHYGKSLTQEAKINPGARMADLTDQYTESVAAGVNQNVLTPEEGVGKIQQVTGEIKKEKREQLKAALTPQENVSPDLYAEKAQILLKDSVEQGVLTPQEATNWYGESISRTLVANSTGDLTAQKQAVANVAEVKVRAQELDLKQKTTLEALKRGIPPDPGVIQDLYSGASEPIKKKLDTELAQGFTAAKFAVLPKDVREEMLANPDLMSSVFYLTDEKDFENLQNVHDNLNKSAEKDPVASVISQKVIENVVPVDMSTTDKMVTSLRNRAVLSGKVYAQTGVKNAGLTNDEMEGIGKAYANASITEKANIAGAIYNAYGKQSEVLFQKLDEKGYKTLGLAGEYFMADNKAAVVDIINGMELLKTNKKLLPDQARLNNFIQSPEQGIEFPEYLDDLGLDGISTGEQRQRVLEAAKAIYASNLAKSGKLTTDNIGTESEATFDAKLFQKSLNQALNGGTLKVGQSTIESPFVGATSEDVNKFLGTLTPDQVKHIPQLAHVLKQDAEVKTMDAVGNKVKGRTELQRVLQEDTVWVSLGNGNYRVGLKASARNQESPELAGLVKIGEREKAPAPREDIYFFTDGKGKPLTVNLRQMMQGEKYNDYNNVPHVVPQYAELLGQVAASEASSREWSKIRERELDVTPTPEDPALANFTMSGDGTGTTSDGMPWQ